MSACSYIQMSELLSARTGAQQGRKGAGPPQLGPRTVAVLADTFRMLGDPTRIRILDALAGGELCVSDTATLVGISESAVSHQLRLMRGMRLVRARRLGRQVFYAVDDRHIVELLRLAITHAHEEDRAR